MEQLVVVATFEAVVRLAHRDAAQRGACVAVEQAEGQAAAPAWMLT